MLRWAHDHHRNLPTLDAAARAAGLSRTNRDGNAVNRHGSYPRYVVAMWLRPSTPRAPIGSPAPFGMHIAAAITQFAHTWPQIPATIAQQNFWDADPEQYGGHQNRPRRHSHNLKSP